MTMVLASKSDISAYLSCVLCATAMLVVGIGILQVVERDLLSTSDGADGRDPDPVVGVVVPVPVVFDLGVEVTGGVEETGIPSANPYFVQAHGIVDVRVQDALRILVTLGRDVIVPDGQGRHHLDDLTRADVLGSENAPPVDAAAGHLRLPL